MHSGSTSGLYLRSSKYILELHSNPLTHRNVSPQIFAPGRCIYVHRMEGCWGRAMEVGFV